AASGARCGRRGGGRDHRRGASASGGSAVRRPAADSGRRLPGFRGRDSFAGPADGPPDRLTWLAGERGAVEPADSLESAVGGAELVLVAAPVAALPAQVAAVLEASDGATVT